MLVASIYCERCFGSNPKHLLLQMKWTSTEKKRLWKNFIFSPGYLIVPFSNTTPQTLITVPLRRCKKMMTKFLKPALLPGSVHGTKWLYGSGKHLQHKDPFTFYFFNLSLVNPGNCTDECGVCECVTLLRCLQSSCSVQGLPVLGETTMVPARPSSQSFSPQRSMNTRGGTPKNTFETLK